MARAKKELKEEIANDVQAAEGMAGADSDAFQAEPAPEASTITDCGQTGEEAPQAMDQDVDQAGQEDFEQLPPLAATEDGKDPAQDLTDGQEPQPELAPTQDDPSLDAGAQAEYLGVEKPGLQETEIEPSPNNQVSGQESADAQPEDGASPKPAAQKLRMPSRKGGRGWFPSTPSALWRRSGTSCATTCWTWLSR